VPGEKWFGTGSMSVETIEVGYSRIETPRLVEDDHIPGKYRMMALLTYDRGVTGNQNN